MARKLTAEFRCQRDDGTCGASILVDGDGAPEWRLESGNPADLQDLYLRFVVENMVCPAIPELCKRCLPPEFGAKVKELTEWPDRKPGTQE